VVLYLSQSAIIRTKTPFLTYCYVDLKTSCQIVSRPRFVEHCEQWRNRSTSDDLLATVFDGKIWKDFLQYEGTRFLSNPHIYVLILNLDWFQPYKYISYSVGVLYLSVLNFPCHMRYKNSFTILVGILPGPHKLLLTLV